MHAQSRTARQASGHVALVKGARGARWYGRGRYPGGRSFQKLLGPAWLGKGRPPEGHLTRKTAEAALRQLLTDAERGTLAMTRRTGVTFGDACAEWLRWLEHDRRRRPSYLRDCRWTVRLLLEAFGEATPLENVTAARIEAWREQLVSEGRLAARTINKRLTLLHGIFRRAGRVWGVPNAASGLDRQPARQSGDISILLPDEVHRLGLAADDEQDAALYTVAAYTGLRMGELLALRWADVEWAKRLLHVRRSYTYGHESEPKSGRVRSVPLLAQAAAALDALSQRERFTDPDDLVFSSPTGSYLDGSALRRRFKAALAQAELKPIRFHDLRHSFGSLAVQAYPLTDVKVWMGHADISTTMIYVHHVPQHDAADRLSQLVSAYEANPRRSEPAVERVAVRVAEQGISGVTEVTSEHVTTPV